jgi:hypothetical protein
MSGHTTRAAHDPVAGEVGVDRFYGCTTGKIGWVSKAAAKRGLKQARRQGRHIKAVYLCKHCNGWHLTSQVPRTSPTSAVA